MDERAEFAKAALTGLLARLCIGEAGVRNALAAEAWQWADAMLGTKDWAAQWRAEMATEIIALAAKAGAS